MIFPCSSPTMRIRIKSILKKETDCFVGNFQPGLILSVMGVMALWLLSWPCIFLQ